MHSMRRASQENKAASNELEKDVKRERQTAGMAHRLQLADAKRRENKKIKAARR